MKRILLIGLLLAACDVESPKVNGYPAYDLWGNRYPVACQSGLTDVDAPISYVSRTEMDQFRRPQDRGKGALLGWTQYAPPHIFIWDGLSGRQLSEAVRHERCHVVAGRWHAE